MISAPDRQTCAEAPPAVFRLPKAGSSAAEYEDAVAWSRHARRYAVADGASASAFARLWAYLLVHAYTAGRLRAEQLEDDLAPVQARWAELVERRPLAWYALEQARRGAFAALVGLSLAPDGTWSALAVGDCCLFQVRDAQLVVAFPLQSPEAFHQRPLLLGSRQAANTALRAAEAVGTTSGTWQRGDAFLLMSDALAAAFLEAVRGRSAASPLASLDFPPTPAGFRAWVRSLRSQQRLRNDDVSLLWLSVATDAAA